MKLPHGKNKYAYIFKNETIHILNEKVYKF